MRLKSYLQSIESRVGREANYFERYDNGRDPALSVFGFDNYPRNGRFTYFSYGLHLLNKPEWEHGRPEYFLTIDQSDRQFALFFAYMLSVFASEKSMNWATLMELDVNAVDGFPYCRIALGPPRYLGWNDYHIDCGEAIPIALGMAYLISNDDFQSARDRGFQFLADKLEIEEDYWWRVKPI